MSLVITDAGIYGDKFAFTSEQAAHAMHLMLVSLRDKAHLQQCHPLALMKGMAQCIGHTFEGDTGRDWADANFQTDHYELHHAMLVLLVIIYDDQGWPKPNLFEPLLMVLRALAPFDDKRVSNA